MKLLGWDTSSKSGALVALEWDPDSCRGIQDVRLITEMTLNVDSTHSERLLWGIHQVLESARWRLEEIDVFGVGVGPGSFTGLRIGITTARTLAHTLKKPLMGVSSLAALVRPLAFTYAQEYRSYQTTVIAVTDACKGELFALWGKAQSVVACAVVPEAGMPGLWNPEVEEQVIAPKALIQVIQKEIQQAGKNARWIAIGEGRHRYLEEWAQLENIQELQAPVPYLNQVQGRYLGLLAWEAFQVSLKQDSLQIHPRYLRASDAELKLKAGLLPPGPVRG